MHKWLLKKYTLLLEKYDWFIYRIAFKSIRRMCVRSPGIAYLFELWIKEWRRQNPITPQLKRSTELFFETQLAELKRKENHVTRTQ